MKGNYRVIHYGWMGNCECPEVTVRVETSVPEDARDIELNFEAYGAEYDDVDTLFATKDGDGNYVIQMRHGFGAVEFVENIVKAGKYSVEALYGWPEGVNNKNVQWTVELSPTEIAKLDKVKHQLANQLKDSDTPPDYEP